MCCNEPVVFFFRRSRDEKDLGVNTWKKPIYSYLFNHMKKKITGERSAKYVKEVTVYKCRYYDSKTVSIRPQDYNKTTTRPQQDYSKTTTRLQQKHNITVYILV